MTVLSKRVPTLRNSDTFLHSPGHKQSVSLVIMKVCCSAEADTQAWDRKASTETGEVHTLFNQNHEDHGKKPSQIAACFLRFQGHDADQVIGKGPKKHLFELVMKTLSMRFGFDASIYPLMRQNLKPHPRMMPLSSFDLNIASDSQ